MVTRKKQSIFYCLLINDTPLSVFTYVTVLHTARVLNMGTVGAFDPRIVLHINSPSSNELRTTSFWLPNHSSIWVIQHTCSQYEKYSTVGAFDTPTQCAIICTLCFISHRPTNSSYESLSGEQTDGRHEGNSEPVWISCNILLLLQ